MTTSPLRRNLFTIAPGTPFLKNFVIAFLSGQILPSISYAATPFTIARTKIYVPTRRAAQALKEQFEQNRLSSALLLPQILPLGGLNEHASEDLFAGNKGNSFDHFHQKSVCCSNRLLRFLPQKVNAKNYLLSQFYNFLVNVPRA
jgi:inactivated superfamily I helicase